jgi:hypothetical protein
MQTLVDDSGIFYRGIEKLTLPLVLVGASRKGQTPGRVTPSIAPGLSTRKWISKMASPGPLPDVFTIELLAKRSRALFPLVHQWRPHHKHDWCDLARLQDPSCITWCVQAPIEQEVCETH